MKTYYISWSGGVDSTFVVTQLSQFPVAIQPVYFKGQTFRLSEPQELSAIETISQLLARDPRTKAELFPVCIIEKDDPRIKDREIVSAHRRIYIRLLEEYKEKHGGKLPPAGSQEIYSGGAFVSPQYAAISSFAQNIGNCIEIGLLPDDLKHIPVKSSQFVNILDEATGRNVSYFHKDDADEDVYELFKNFCFPIIGQGMCKQDIWKWFKEKDYLQIRHSTNFCQSPVIHEDGTYEPCGICTPCIGVIRSNVLEPFTKEGLLRYQDYEENHEKEPERFRLKGF